MSPADAVTRLRLALVEVERGARNLPWSGRPGDTWTTREYVRLERGVPAVDLHDLDRDLAREVVDEVLALRAELGPVVRLITGRGRHSDNGKAVLRELVQQRLSAAGVRFDARAPGHLDVRLAPERGFWATLWAFVRALLTGFSPDGRRGRGD